MDKITYLLFDMKIGRMIMTFFFAAFPINTIVIVLQKLF